MTISTT